MTRIDSMRAATGSAKDSVLHAAEVVAPYADTAKDKASHYAQEARVRLAPKVSQAAEQARVQYGAHVVPRLEQARTHVPPKVDHAAHEAAVRTRKAARQAADYSRPRIEQAVAAAGPVREEATARSVAALAALRGQVSPQQIQKLVRRQQRRARAAEPSRARPSWASWRRRLRRLEVVGQAGQPRLAGRAPRRDRGLRPRSSVLRRRQWPVRPRPRGPGQAGRGRGRRPRQPPLRTGSRGHFSEAADVPGRVPSRLGLARERVRQDTFQQPCGAEDLEVFCPTGLFHVKRPSLQAHCNPPPGMYWSDCEG